MIINCALGLNTPPVGVTQFVGVLYVDPPPIVAGKSQLTLAAPLVFSNGAIHAVTCTTRQPGGFTAEQFADLEATKAAIGPQTAGILIEPVQGEGGVRSAPQSFFKALRQLCDDNGLLLIFDEVQTGMGRTGDLFAYKRLGVTPDVMSLAKALGGGFPIGACLATAEAASGMTPGSHGSTFGGNPLAIAAANAVLDVMLKPGFFDHVQKMSLLLKQKLASVVDRYPTVLSEVRGEGLLVGVKAVVPSGDLVNALRSEKLLTVGAGDNVVRLLPPLIVSATLIIGVAILFEAGLSFLGLSDPNVMSWGLIISSGRAVSSIAIS